MPGALTSPDPGHPGLAVERSPRPVSRGLSSGGSKPSILQRHPQTACCGLTLVSGVKTKKSQQTFF